MFDAVIFDMDGVLVDTEGLSFSLAAQVAAEKGFDLPKSLYVRTIGRTRADTVDEYKQYFIEDFDIEYLMAETDTRMADHIARQGIPVKPGAVQLLRWLTGRGIPLAVATSSASARAKQKLEKAGLAGFFRATVCGDMVVHGKPAPDIYLAAARALGIPPGRCVAFEDSPYGIRAAVAAGMPVVMVPDLVEPDDSLRALAAAVLPSLTDAPAWLEKALG